MFQGLRVSRSHRLMQLQALKRSTVVSLDIAATTGTAKGRGRAVAEGQHTRIAEPSGYMRVRLHTSMVCIDSRMPVRAPRQHEAGRAHGLCRRQLALKT